MMGKGRSHQHHQPPHESQEMMEEQEDPNKATLTIGILLPAKSQDNIIVHMTEAELCSLD